MTIEVGHRAGRAGTVLTALTVSLTSCGSPQDASKDNFRAALQSWFDQHGECVNIGDMPAKVRADAPSRNKAGYQAMVAARLLTVETGCEKQSSFMGKHRTDDYLVYRPTDVGANVIREAAGAFLGRNELCFATRNIVEVTSWTQPGDVMGLHVSQVRYQYRLDDLAPWSADPSMRAAFPKMARALDTGQSEDKASLILTNEGWRHEKSLR